MELGLWTVPGRRSSAGPADWRANGNCWGAFKMVILFGRHADGAVEPEILAVELCVAGQFEHQAAEPLGLAQALGEVHRGRAPLEDLRRLVLDREHRRRRENARPERHRKIVVYGKSVSVRVDLGGSRFF